MSVFAFLVIYAPENGNRKVTLQRLYILFPLLPTPQTSVCKDGAFF